MGGGGIFGNTIHHKKSENFLIAQKSVVRSLWVKHLAHRHLLCKLVLLVDQISRIGLFKVKYRLRILAGQAFAKQVSMSQII